MGGVGGGGDVGGGAGFWVEDSPQRAQRSQRREEFWVLGAGEDSRRRARRVGF